MNDTLSNDLLEAQASSYRLVAAAASKAAVAAVHRESAGRLPSVEGDDGEVTRLAYHSGHAGAAPDRLDVVAKDAALDVWLDELARLGVGARQVVVAGEEAGAPTQQIVPGQLIVRQDSLDGTNNVLRLCNAFSSVQLVDVVRSVGDQDQRARHLAGAITTANGTTVSWHHTSAYDRGLRDYRRLVGSVFLEAEPWGIPESRVHERRWERAAGTVASVASSRTRRDALDAALVRLGIEATAVYNLAGTPLAPALIGGDIDLVLEPNPVSLHDSALLIPHQLLGGAVTDLFLRPLNYMREYERSALDFSPAAKPIAGYAAWGAAVPAGARVA